MQGTAMATQQTFDFLDKSALVRDCDRIQAPPVKDRGLCRGSRPVCVAGEIPFTEITPPTGVMLDPPHGTSRGDHDRSVGDRSVEERAAAHQQTDRESVLRELRAKVGCVDSPANSIETLSTGSDAINHLLPRVGLRLDAITEWVAEADGSGAAALSMITVATHLRSPHAHGPVVVVCGQNDFYPPAAVALGVPAERIVWVRPIRHADMVWAIDQALRCESVAAVWAHVGANLDDRDARRFQLAAETGRTPGLFVRPAAVRGRPSFADVRLHVQTKLSTDSLGRVMNVTLDRSRGAAVGRSVWVQIDDRMIDDRMIDERGNRCVARIRQVTPQQLGISKNETAAVRLASELAHPKTANPKTANQGGASRRRA